MKRKSILVVMLAIFAVLGLINSCEVGLGNSVDTLQPNLEISYPETGAVIKNSFVMEGKASDETWIKSIIVKVKNSENGEEVKNYEAVLNGENWKVEINKNQESGYELKDGTYEIQVEAKDSADRTTKASVTYTIDNTAPIVVLKRPGLDDSYGRTVKITGDINDSHALEKLVFKAYEKTGENYNEIVKQEYKNISGVGLDLVVAQYYDNPNTEEEKKLNTIYKSLYGEGTGTKNLFCTIEVFDTAKEYKGLEADRSVVSNGNGNKSKEYYLYEEIYEKVLSANGFGIPSSSLTKVFNGTYENSAEGKEIIEYLSTMGISGESAGSKNGKVSKFSLNPENSPKYEVRGYEIKGFVDDNKLTNEASINIAINPGRDGIGIKSGSIRVSLKQCDKDCNIIDENERILIYSEDEISNLEGEAKTVAEQNRKDCIEVGETINITVGVGILKANKCYKVEVQGVDLEGNEIENEKRYGFEVQSNSKPPMIEIENGIDDLSVQKNNEFYFSGTYSSEKDVEIYCYVEGKNEKGSGTIARENIAVTTNKGEGSGSWEVDINNLTEAPSNSLYLYTVTIYAEDEDGNTSSEITRRIHVDTKKPSIEKKNITPQVSVNGREDNVNGKITVSGTVSDNYTLSNSGYSLYVGEGETAVKTGNFGESTTFSFDIDTTDTTRYEDKKELKIVLKAIDTAGNESEEGIATVYIDQSTDLPEITLTNAEVELKDSSLIQEGTNLFDQTGNNKILGNVSDDDSISSIKVEYQEAGKNDWKVIKETTGINKSTSALNVGLQSEGKSLKEGVYKIRLTAEDENGKETSKEFYIGIDGSAPKITISSQQEAFQSGEVTVKGFVTDGNGIKSFTREGNEVEVKENGEWEDKFEAGEVGREVIYTATDNYGRTSQETFTYKVDKNVPSLEVSTEGEVYIGTTLTSLKSFSGTAEDGEDINSSGINKIEYSLDGGNSWIECIGTSQWNGNIDFSKVSTEEVDVKFRAKDNAGNLSEEKIVKVNIDREKPEIGEVEVEGAKEEEGIYYISDEKVKVSVRVSDSNLSSVTIDGEIIEGEEGLYTKEIDIKEGQNSCTLEGKDKAEQITEKNISIYKDSKAPTAEISSVSPLVTANGKGNNVNGEISIQGTARDDDKVLETKVKISLSASEDGDYEEVNNAEALKEVSNDKMRYAYSINTTKLEDKKYLKITVETKDRSGNIGEASETVYIDQTTDLPGITFSNVNEESEAEENLFGMGSYTIYGTATDDDGLQEIKAKLDENEEKVLYNSSVLKETTSKSIEYKIDEELNGEHKLSFIIKDKNGNEKSKSINFVVDNDIPSIRIEEPSGEFAPKELEIRGKASDNNGIKRVSYVEGEEIKAVEGKEEWSYEVSHEEDGEYEREFEVEDNYGRVSKVKVSYTVDSKKPVIGTIKINGKGYTGEEYLKESALKVSSTLSEEHSDGVSYKVKGEKSETEGIINVLSGEAKEFSFPIMLEEGTSTLTLSSKDKAGNEAQQKVITINVDITSPEVEGLEWNKKIVNGEEEVGLSFNVTEELSGLKRASVETKEGEKLGETDLSSEEDGEKEVRISGEKIKSLTDGRYTLRLKVEDKAGNIKEVEIPEIIVDMTSPKVTYSEPMARAVVNKKVEVKGSVTDSNLGTNSEGKLYKKTDNGSWEELTEEKISVSGNNWQILSLDTEKLHEGEEEKEVEIQVRFKDEAGNEIGEEGATLVLKVNQGSDIPEIKVTNIELAGNGSENAKTLKMNSIYGTIKDDDGIQRLQISDNGEVGYKDVEVDGGSWTYEIEKDGTKEIWFKVTDASGSTFESGKGKLEGVRVVGGDNEESEDGKIYLMVDTKAPEIGNIEWEKNAEDWSGTYPTEAIGGSREELRLRTTVTDINGIESVTVKFNGKETEAEERDGYYILKIDTSTGNNYTEAKVKAVDKAGVEAEKTVQILLDHTAPVINIGSHKTGEQVNGTIVMNGYTDGASKMKFAVKKESGAQIDWETAQSLLGETFSTWSIYFDGNGGDGYTHGKKLNQYLIDLGITTKEDLEKEDGAYNTITPLYFTIYSEDECGNKSTKEMKLEVDPQGDRPKVTIVYPENDGAKLGGTIQVTGSASDNTKVEKVYIQIDGNYDGKEFVPGDAAYWAEVNRKYETTYELKSFGTGLSGFEVTGTLSWNVRLNTKGEFDPEVGEGGTTKTRKIKVRIYAVDEDENISQSIDREIEIDSDTPYLGNAEPFYLNQYDGNGNKIASIEYKDDMWISGEWYLEGSVEDASGIKEISVNGEKIVSFDKETGIITVEKEDQAEEVTGSYKGYRIKIPVGSSEEDKFGKLEYKIIGMENTGNEISGTKIIKLNYDNKAPEIVGEGDKDFKIGKEIVNSNGFYTLSSVATEHADGNDSQSGVRLVAFSFVRELGGKEEVFDPMKKGIKESGLEERSGLYWKDIRVTRNEDNLPVIVLESKPSWVRTGGLVEMSGSLYMIVGETGNVVTLDGSPSKEIEEASFAMAQVVNNMTVEMPDKEKEKNGDGYYPIPNDDGDGMVEYLNHSSTEYKWEGYINSKNISDGTIKIKYSVYDKAGNVSSGEVAGEVSNNRPRLAGVKFGTDDNGSGTIEANELTTTWSGMYTEENTGVPNGYENATIKVHKITIPESKDKSVLTIKGTTKIKPEIVGGNNGIGYTYNVTESGKEKPYYTSGLKVISETHDDTDAVRSSNINDIDLTVVDLLKAGIQDGKKQTFTFDLWDKTEGKVQGVNSQKATVEIVMDVALQDSENPTASINPFYWKSSSENSIGKEGNGKLLGHIELEEDLTAGIIKDLGGDDPKVSGVVIVEGEASDNILLEELLVNIKGLTTGYKTIAKRENGKWVSKVTLAADGIEFEEESVQAENGDVVDQEGNRIKWRFLWDTSKTIVAAKDVTVQIQAKDRGPISLNGAGTDVEYKNPNSSQESTTQTTSDATTSYYKVDVVPYITGVRTQLSNLSEDLDTASVYSRTALGNYPVRENETVTITGFNLTGYSATIGGVGVGTGSVNIETTAKSGELVVTVNGVESLNNKNDNNANGDFEEVLTGENAANYYNRSPNGVNNNTLTDDVKIDIWQFQNVAEPKNGKSSNPTLKISPKGRIGVAFSNAVVYYSAPFIKNDKEQNTDNVMTQTAIAKNYGWFTNNTFCFDPYGYPYAIAQCPDTDSEIAAAYMQFFSRKTGTSIKEMDLNQNYQKAVNSARLEAICVPLKTGETEWITDIDRTKSIAMVATMPNSSAAPNNVDNKVTVHIAYYDNLTKQIRYRNGDVGTNPSDFGVYKNNNQKTNFGGSLLDLEGLYPNQFNTGNWRYSTPHGLRHPSGRNR